LPPKPHALGGRDEGAGYRDISRSGFCADIDRLVAVTCAILMNSRLGRAGDMVNRALEFLRNHCRYHETDYYGAPVLLNIRLVIR